MKNWEKFRSKIIQYIRMQKLINGAQNLKRGHDVSELDLEEENFKCMEILLHPESSKRAFFENIVSIFVILDIYVNIYSLCFQADTSLFMSCLIPIYLLEIFIS